MSEYPCCHDHNHEGNCDKHKPVVHITLPIPRAWNVGPMPETAEERAAANAEMDAPPPTSKLDVYPPGHDFPYRNFGKQTATAVVTHNGKVVGMFGPETIGLIRAYWREHGVDV